MAFDTLLVNDVEGSLSLQTRTTIDQLAHHQHGVGGNERLVRVK